LRPTSGTLAPIEINEHCNLICPLCFAGVLAREPNKQLSLKTVKRRPRFIGASHAFVDHDAAHLGVPERRGAGKSQSPYPLTTLMMTPKRGVNDAKLAKSRARRLSGAACAAFQTVQDGLTATLVVHDSNFAAGSMRRVLHSTTVWPRNR
jgi:hypothetical protein